ncbi:ABC transporter ATP-binding protein [Anaerococcus porci]|uniref:ABC transporter ATP-binding protein n=1 Tax=Anaerococcus porci TaxID=2652269 RepID=UPI002A749476|nr:ABC transporter ATP-binding protein [Anaerococcus porci]MDY3005625.1 ABC transporter ATP-binding protein [Anaerococcus porci]
MISALKKIWNFAGQEKNNINKSLVISFVYAIFHMFQIGAVYFVLLGIVEKNNSLKPGLLALIFLIVSILGRAVTNYFSQLKQTHASYHMTADKRIEIGKKVKSVPMGYFNENSEGQVVGIMTTIMSDIENTIPIVLINMMSGFLNSIVFTLIILIYDKRIGIVVILTSLLYLYVTSLMERKSAQVAPKRQISQTKLVETILEQIKGMHIIKSFNLTGKGDKKVQNAIRENKGANLNIEKSFTPYNMAQELVLRIGSITIGFSAVYLYFNNSMNLVNTLMSIIISFMVFAQIESAGSSMAVLRVVSSSIDQVEELNKMPQLDIHGENIETEHMNIEFKKVNFSYGNKKIIKDLSLLIKENTTTAIIGPSGSGKTTLCNLIARFWDVNSGQILLGGRNIKDYSLESLMNKISMVFQKVYLFEDTIENNIKFGNQNASLDEVIEAAKKASCHDFIMKLPDAYQTMVGEGGANLSGGEKQRISLARAMLKNAQIVILDEATANVDPENEDKLQKAIDALMKEKTVIMIAHRLKTVQNADQIIVLDRGEIIEKGNHEQLIEKEGLYSDFIKIREETENWKL